MVRVFTFVGLCAGTYVGVRALDNLVVWMAERREENMDKFKLEREANLLKQQLLKELQEKQAMTPHEVVEKRHVHLDNNVKLLYKHLKPHTEDERHKLPSKHQERHENAKLLNRRHQFRKTLKEKEGKMASSQLEKCPGEVIAECLECGETFEIVEPVPHGPLQEGRQQK